MDKESLSNYGWVVVCILVLCVMIAFSTPFGHYIGKGVESCTVATYKIMQNKLHLKNLKFGNWDSSISLSDEQFGADSFQFMYQNKIYRNTQEGIKGTPVNLTNFYITQDRLWFNDESGSYKEYDVEYAKGELPDIWKGISVPDLAINPVEKNLWSFTLKQNGEIKGLIVFDNDLSKAYITLPIM